MASPSRKLLLDPVNDTLQEELCSPFCNLSQAIGYCEPPCLSYCLKFCPYDLAPPPTPSNIISNHPNKLLITVISLLATTFVLASCYVLYVKFYLNQSRRRRRRRSLRQERIQTNEESLDEDHGPIVDHPIWYIKTVGLQPSIISSIAVCKFKKGDGLVEGTECSVCLSEFQEDETLRLLPKCSHAFHVPCIDTWLRSHTNCPMCRAPIVVNTAGVASSEGGTDDANAEEEIRIGILENGGVSSGEVGGESGELIRSGSEEEGGNNILEGQNPKRTSDAKKDGMVPIRRSISLDALSALEISMTMAMAKANVACLEFDRNLDVWMEEENDSGSKSAGGSQILLKLTANRSSSSTSSTTSATSGGPQPHLAGSSSNSVIRSLSCSGGLFTARYTRNRTYARPL